MRTLSTTEISMVSGADCLYGGKPYTEGAEINYQYYPPYLYFQVCSGGTWVASNRYVGCGCGGC